MRKLLIILLNHPFRSTVLMLMVLMGLVFGWLFDVIAWWVSLGWACALVLYMGTAYRWLVLSLSDN